MNLPADHIRLLFGLKMRQMRLDKGLSVSELAQQSGLSVSYVTEIEKGRKYPKADKIAALANAMQVDYDTLVSLKLSKKLEPISDLLRSKFLTEIPLELFGIDPSDLLELLAEAPAKVSAMIRTFMDIALSYNMSVERLYLAMLRSYQEMHDNHFPEIEADAERFLNDFAQAGQPVSEALLMNLLKTRYEVQIEFFDPLTQPELVSLRSVFRPEHRRLYLNVALSGEQRSFILAREVGFQYMNLKNRPYTYSWVEAESFEQILNNYKASYFAGAILIRRDALVARLTDLFARDTWSNEAFLQLIADFGSTPERFFYRLSNVLPSHFGIDQLFFYRFNHTAGQSTFQLTKEMHLSRQQGPRGIVDEHFCRRWIAWTILQELQSLQQTKGFDETLCRAQLSEYADSGLQYLIVSVAHPFHSQTQQNISVSMCFAVNDALRSKMKFMNTASNEVPHRVVNEACERCGLFDCRERVAAPVVLQKKRQFAGMKKAMEKLK
ncbi:MULTISPECIES: helix-turn-helix domain-containing protein [Spirosoma]|uniref:Helix-turn-helix domain-containing protein n=1 Tax=Spirosoma liriopis TaxID=2937440 RepID=A0ABT0HFH7_9BACT|nr:MULTISPECIES: helix-turn-helix transcriptional regulator [Spirosoma]MCK8490911.1 helix-turn-helix domain-containing protein [Spirosoma liriopis]UHG90296.1 helix-turn-helix domain-containing protein [Spirosoma oryzicola]